MWKGYERGSTYGTTQDEIWNWIVANFPSGAEPGQGAFPYALAAGAGHFTYLYVTNDHYQYFEGRRRAVADQERGIDNGNPTIAVVFQGYHAVLVVGATWHELASAQPFEDYMIYHDPLRAPRVYATLSNWLNFDIVYPDQTQGAVNIQVSTQHLSALQHLDEFDFWGGTYYGDPDPPEEPPMASVVRRSNGFLAFVRNLLRGLSPRASTNWKEELLAAPRPSSDAMAGTDSVRLEGQEGQQGKEAHERRKEDRIPYPFARTQAGILANIAAGVRQVRLDKVGGLERLAMANGHLTVSRLLDVESLGLRPDYYLVEFEDEEGNPFANVTITQEGWLASVEDVRGMRLPRAADLGSTADSLALAGIGRIRSLRHVYAPSDAQPGASPFVPLVMAETDGGTYYVNAARELFRSDESGGGEATLAGKAGIQRLRRVGKWQ